MQSNPRQTKRIINNFVLAKAINTTIEAEVYLLQEVLFRKWNEFYLNLDSNYDFRLSFKDLFRKRYKTTSRYL